MFNVYVYRVFHEFQNMSLDANFQIFSSDINPKKLVPPNLNSLVFLLMISRLFYSEKSEIVVNHVLFLINDLERLVNTLFEM